MKNQKIRAVLLMSFFVTSFAFVASSEKVKEVEKSQKQKDRQSSDYKRLMSHLLGNIFSKGKNIQYLVENITPALIECTTISYWVDETNGTYLDANLKISVDDDEKVFEYYTNNSSFTVGCESSLNKTVKKFGGFELAVECPVFIQWDYSGEYHLSITARNSSNQLVTLDSGVEYLGPSNTPNSSLLNKTVWVPNGYSDVRISLTSFAGN